MNAPAPIDPEVMPEHGAELAKVRMLPAWLADVAEIPATRVLEELKGLWPSLHTSQWRFAFLLWRADRENLYRPHTTLTSWARDNLTVPTTDTAPSPATVSKYLGGATFIVEKCETAEEVSRALVMSPSLLVDTGIPRLAEHDKDEALRLASSGKPTAAIRDAVKTRLVSPAGANGAAPPVEEIRTFRVLVSESAYRGLMEIWHWTRFRCETPNPTDTEIAQLVRASFDAEIQHDPKQEEHFPLADILTGRVKCIECGASNGNGLESHHVIPKSHQGHDGPQVWLCRGEHADVTENREGTWKQHLRRWCGRKKFEWLKAAVDAFVTARGKTSVDEL